MNSLEQIQLALNQAPSFVRDAITDPTTSELIAEIGLKHHLHVDAIGILARANTEMLLGLISTSQFMRALEEAGVPDDETLTITNELNEKFYRPIHDKLRGIPTNTPPKPEPKKVYAPVPEVMPVTTPNLAPEPVAEQPSPTPEVSIVTPGETFVPTPVPQQPLPQAETQPAPAWTPPTAPIPQPPPPRPALTPKLPPPVLTDNRNELRDVLKKYVSDPYREIPE